RKMLPGREVVSAQTARTLRGLLEQVVADGTGRHAQVEGYRVGGKTGTAQKMGPDGRYSHSDFVASFVGFAPADNPVVTVLVMLDEPRPVYYGGLVSAPVFSEIVSQVLPHLGVTAEKQEVSVARAQP
ncbi:MAG: hypothetical protein JW937_09190, partial [Candidatus Omnitrophica bacterium]|nr:hypothetical protein [Candidatus Omnitrophota bacterium]